ncbi:hypothetical protein PAPYR_7616 [Paratrimastix pyriformis]|uniref:Kinesin motor domain-containing protein n=1 Tax=Paratrimastix pyriformis TaxID=342808 RepID=A0ABQ8UHS4_9EUKA|nr:hypothetical protein PAPYR_7616 [Paratrimastix pyriformis]
MPELTQAGPQQFRNLFEYLWVTMTSSGLDSENLLQQSSYLYRDPAAGQSSMYRQPASDAQPGPQLPISVERFLYLLKKNLSRSKANRLTPEEIEELKAVKAVTTKQQWDAYTEQAKQERRVIRQWPKGERRLTDEKDRDFSDQQRLDSPLAPPAESLASPASSEIPPAMRGSPLDQPPPVVSAGGVTSTSPMQPEPPAMLPQGVPSPGVGSTTQEEALRREIDQLQQHIATLTAAHKREMAQAQQDQDELSTELERLIVSHRKDTQALRDRLQEAQQQAAAAAAAVAAAAAPKEMPQPERTVRTPPNRPAFLHPTLIPPALPSSPHAAQSLLAQIASLREAVDQGAEFRAAASSLEGQLAQEQSLRAQAQEEAAQGHLQVADLQSKLGALQNEVENLRHLHAAAEEGLRATREALAQATTRSARAETELASATEARDSALAAETASRDERQKVLLELNQLRDALAQSQHHEELLQAQVQEQVTSLRAALLDPTAPAPSPVPGSPLAAEQARLLAQVNQLQQWKLATATRLLGLQRQTRDTRQTVGAGTEAIREALASMGRQFDLVRSAFGELGAQGTGYDTFAAEATASPSRGLLPALVANPEAGRIVFQPKGREYREFRFDKVLAANDATDGGMGEMVGQLGRPFADRALTGLNSTLISYGERMAGKTFVLDGCPSASPSGLPSAGVASAVVRELFAMVSDAHQRNVTRFSVTVTCVELKGDLIRDLFSTSSGPSAPKHDIRRDPEGHMFVSDLTYVQVRICRGDVW